MVAGRPIVRSAYFHVISSVRSCDFQEDPTMSTPNFTTNRDFSLMILESDNYRRYVCPECGMLLFSDDGVHHYCDSCDFSTDDPGDLEYMIDYLWYEDDTDMIERDLKDFTDSLRFFGITLVSGYYTDVQAKVYAKASGTGEGYWRCDTSCDFDPHDLDNYDCRSLWDLCRSDAIRKYDAEKRRVQKFVDGLTNYGMRKIYCVGIFSNGEAVYQYA